jgi:hypothetical protein
MSYFSMFSLRIGPARLATIIEDSPVQFHRRKRRQKAVMTWIVRNEPETRKNNFRRIQMSHNQRRYTAFFVILVFVITTSACVPPAYRKHTDFDTVIQNIEAPGLMPPNVKIYELTAGGVQELRDDWSEQGQSNVLNAIEKGFADKNYQIISCEIPEDMEEEVEDILATYRAVSTSIQLHTYPGASQFPEKMKNFDYSLGSIESLLEPFDADAMIFVYGSDEISTGGRKALMAVGILVGAFTGVAVMPRSGITAVSIAIVDPSGRILWYSVKGSAGGQDLRKPESAASLVESILADFPSFE